MSADETLHSGQGDAPPSERVCDEVVAAWARTKNRGAPPWDAMDESSRSWWRRRYANRPKQALTDLGEA